MKCSLKQIQSSGFSVHDTIFKTGCQVLISLTKSYARFLFPFVTKFIAAAKNGNLSLGQPSLSSYEARTSVLGRMLLPDREYDPHGRHLSGQRWRRRSPKDKVILPLIQFRLIKIDQSDWKNKSHVIFSIHLIGQIQWVAAELILLVVGILQTYNKEKLRLGIQAFFKPVLRIAWLVPLV